MSVSTNDLKNGMALNLPEGLMTVIEFQHVKPGKGGAFAQVEMRDLRSGNKTNERFRTQETVDRVRLDEKEMQFLYMDGGLATFMDNESYEQIGVDPAALGDATKYIKEGDTVILPMYQEQVVGVELPAAVELTVAQTDPGVQGDRVSGAKKPATLETGAVVQVPLFVETGDRVKVDTRTGEYLTRV